MDPADTESEAGWAKTVGQCQKRRFAAPHDEQPVQLDAVDVLLQDRCAAASEGEGFGEMLLDLPQILDQEQSPLST